VRSPGRIALLAFMARQSVSDEQPEGNHFRQSTDSPSWSTMPAPDPRMASTADMPAIPQDWTRRVDAATDALAERHGTSQTAERRNRQIADLLCLARRRGSRSFQARPPSATSCFSRRRNREICTGLLLLSAFQSQDVGYRGAMVKEKPGVLPGLLFGLGFGGFVDGIVLPEILQWHQMISGAQSSETLTGLELNIAADGFFHVVTWLLVMAGSITTLVSWRQGRLAPTWSFHFGLLVAGWGFFNLVEGPIDHQLLGVHDARHDLGAPLSWDIGFLVFGVILIGAGWVLYRRGSRKLAGSAR